jgi:putative FmdB family regulatory protein
MPMYDYRCANGHRFERIVPLTDGGSQACPACGVDSAKVPSRVALGGTADVGRSMEQMPQTWKGTYGANREYVTQLRREWDGRQRLEEKHPELRGDRRPILAHEGRFENAPLRAGDPLVGSSPSAEAAGHGHTHGHSHGRAHGGTKDGAQGAGGTD